MFLNLKNALRASSIALFATSMNVYAETESAQNSCTQSPCEEKCPTVECCVEPVSEPCAFAYPYYLDLNCPRDTYFRADFLYMQAKQDGLEFAIENKNGVEGGSDPLIRGPVHSFTGESGDFSWNPGMRLGLGFYLAHDAWNLDFDWTWVHVTNYERAVATDPNGVFVPLQTTGAGNTGTTVFGKSVSSKWNAKYNTVDARLGKPYYVSRYLTFHPHFGLRGACIDQNYSVSYAGSTNHRTIFDSTNNFWGVGSRVGLDTEWIMGQGWSFFGNVAASMLFGRFDVDQNMRYGSTTVLDQGFDIDFDSYQNVPNMEIVLGFSWGTYFNCHKNHVSFKAAYEFHEWWDQLNIRKFYSGSTGYANDVVSRGNFTLNGVSFRVQIDI